MLFNSIDFAIFLPLVFVLFWAMPAQQSKARNWVILVASYIFYGWWDWRFLWAHRLQHPAGLLHRPGHGRTTDERRRKLLLWTSLAVNLGLLGFFKYFNFFLDQLDRGLHALRHGHPRAGTLDIILPVGISFYTFQTLSYTIDVYRGDLKPSRDPVAFAAFVSFFPQLVAGPDRAGHQPAAPVRHTARVRSRSTAVDGSRQILWGFFKKMVIADNCAEQADIIFGAHGTYGGSTLLLGAVLFAFQIYGDFSGYSDIAIGAARLFGFTLMRNFAFPYFSRDIAEFWRRWHISLSTWFRDYLYIPLGGSRGGTAMRVRNTFIIFLVSGFWHGANWTFVVWGALNALYFLPLLLTQRNRQNLGMVAEGRLLPSPREAMQVLLTFALTCVAWVFFRARNVEQAVDYLAGMASPSLLHPPHIGNNNLYLLLPIFVGIEWWGRHGEHALEQRGPALEPAACAGPSTEC